MRTLPVRDVAPGVVVEGPVPELVEEVQALHRRFHTGKAGAADDRDGRNGDD